MIKMELSKLKSNEDAYNIAYRFFKMILSEINFHNHSSKYLTSDESEHLRQYYGSWTKGKSEFFGHYFAQRLRTAIKMLMSSKRKGDLKTFTTNSKAVCRIQEGSTNIYLSEERTTVALKRLKYYKDFFSLNPQNVNFRNMNILDYKSTKPFDLVYAKESITHVYSVPKFINFVNRVLENDGYFIITDANPLNPLVSYKAWKVHKKELYVSVVNPETSNAVPYAVERLVSPFYLRSLLSKRGFQSIYYFYGSPPLPSALVPSLKIFENKIKCPILALYEIVSKKHLSQKS